jgi:dCMP deaminase
MYVNSREVVVVTDVEQKFFEMVMARAYNKAWESNDQSTKNGAILVKGLDPLPLAQGVNHFTPGFDDTDEALHARPRKYEITEHAERAAIYDAAANGVSTYGLTMVCPWACCTDCARAIVLAGIRVVVAHKQAADKTPERWQAEVDAGIDICKRGGVKFVYLDAKIGRVKNLFSGEVWLP